MNVIPCQLLLMLLIGLWTGTPENPDPAAPLYPVEECGTENFAFKPGEEIVYKIYYHLNPLWVSAGEVSFKVEEAGDHYRFKVIGFSYSSLEWFYKGRYTFESEVDKESLMTKQFVRTIQEKKFSKYNKFVFDQANRKVTTWQGKTAHEAEKKSQEVSACMHDMISILYYMRNVNFDQMRVGQSLPVDVFMEEEYPLKVKVIGSNVEKRIKGIGKQQTHVVRPEVIAGDVFDEDAQMTVWISADQNHVPLMIESPVRVGNVKVVLHSYKGLRHPFVCGE